jgi:hypothetical protein
MRISIRKSNRLYLERLSAQMETDPAEAVNYLLTELRRVGYSFNANVTLTVGGFELGHASEAEVKPKELGSTGSLMAAVAKDPMIQHLLSVGLEEF